MSFRTKQTIIRTSNGSYNEDGNYTEGTTEEITIFASVQPISLDEYTKMFPSGSRTVNAVKIYTNTKLYPDKENEQEADVLEWDDRKWKIIACHAYQSKVISHYKAYAQEV